VDHLRSLLLSEAIVTRRVHVLPRAFAQGIPANSYSLCPVLRRAMRGEGAAQNNTGCTFPLKLPLDSARHAREGRVDTTFLR
jgi:hypothetical protein